LNCSTRRNSTGWCGCLVPRRCSRWRSRSGRIAPPAQPPGRRGHGAADRSLLAAWRYEPANDVWLKRISDVNELLAVRISALSAISGGTKVRLH
jgi:hypothetical protein